MVNRELIVSSIIKIEIILLIRQMLIQYDLPLFNFEPGKKSNYSGEGMEYPASALKKKFHK